MTNVPRLASKVKQLEQFSYVEQFKIYEGEKNVFIMVHFHDISTLVLSSAVLKIHRLFTFFISTVIFWWQHPTHIVSQNFENSLKKIIVKKFLIETMFFSPSSDTPINVCSLLSAQQSINSSSNSLQFRMYAL